MLRGPTVAPTLSESAVVSGKTVSPPESDGGGLVEGGLLIVARMPVEFLSDAEAAAYGRYDGGPSREELDRVFFLDDADRELIEKRRGEHNRLGFALQLTTARWLGVFLPDPTDVPTVVLDYVTRQLEIADLSCVGRYLERRPTRFDHAEEIKRACGLRECAQARSEFDGWLWARAWMTGDAPRAIFADAIGWLRERDVLLPGVTTLRRRLRNVRGPCVGAALVVIAAAGGPAHRFVDDADDRRARQLRARVPRDRARRRADADRHAGL
ncbi:MAG: DUF4158 domain-containing protein [Solirubrobacteraceae bacterium]